MPSVTLANMKISAIDGTAFVDFSTADVLTDYLGRKLTITDSAGKKLIGYIKAAGTGETLGSNVLAPLDFTGADWGVMGGASIVDADTYISAAPTEGIRKVNVMSLWALYLSSVTGSTTSGSVTLVDMSSSNNLYATMNSGNTYFTTPGMSRSPKLRNSDIATTDITTLVMQQVLTPSATGVTIVSTPGGTTYDWASKDVDFNYYDASNYTYEIANTNYAIAAGNWSDTSTWSTGVVPVADEDVDLNGLVVVWDAGVTRIPATGTLKSISSVGTPGQITLDLSNAAFDSGAALYVTTMPAGTKPATAGILLVTGTTSNVLTITCGTTAGTGIIGGTNTDAYGVHATTTGTINVVGRVTGGSGTTSHGVRQVGLNTTLTISNGAYGGSGNTANGVVVQNTAAITISGGATGGSGLRADGLHLTSAPSSFSFSGDVTGGTGGAAHGIFNNNVSNITLPTTTKLINGTKGVAYAGYPPVWQPTAATYMHWYTGASFGQAPDTEFVRNLTAANIKKGTVSGSVTGTLQTVVRPFRKIGTSVVGL